MRFVVWLDGQRRTTMSSLLPWRTNIGPQSRQNVYPRPACLICALGYGFSLPPSSRVHNAKEGGQIYFSTLTTPLRQTRGIYAREGHGGTLTGSEDITSSKATYHRVPALSLPQNHDPPSTVFDCHKRFRRE